MALIKCPKCGKEFSDRAQVCPQCGYQTDNSKKNKRFVVYGLILLALQCIGLIASPSGTLFVHSQEEAAVHVQGGASFSSLLFSLIFVWYFMTFWIRQAKSLSNTTQSIYAYGLAALSLVFPIWRGGAVSLGVLDWIYCVGFLCIGIFILLYGLTLASNSKDFAIASGSLWIISSLFLLLCFAHLLSNINFLLYGVRILPCLSIISTIVFIISCYLPDWKKQKSSNE
jgi:hypothetical protein